MLLFKRRHAHVSLETLSDYLDGRLQESVAGRVDRQVIDCDACRKELESLRSTVLLLRQLPEATPPRSFTLAGPPAQPVEARPLPLLKIPQWAYAAAASAAALVLAVLVSADATGLLVRPDGVGDVAVAREMAGAAPAAPEVDRPERTVPVEVVKSVAAPAKEGVTTAVKREAETSKAQAVTALEAAAPPAPLESQSLAAESPSESRAQAAPDEEPDQQPGLAQELSSEERREETRDETRDETAAATAPTVVPQPASQAAEPAASQEEATGGTAVVWRVVEGLAAAAGLAFLAGLFLKRRTLRRTAKD